MNIVYRLGEPNDVDGSENCVEIMFGNFQWNDVHCNNRFQYICKKRGKQKHIVHCIMLVS